MTVKQEIARMVREETGADLVEVEMDDEHGHITFNITFANRPDDQNLSELLEAFE